MKQEIINELFSIKYCVWFPKQGDNVVETPLFYIRFYENFDYFKIELAEKTTFDRWANSVNFFTERSKTKGTYYPLFKPQYIWAVKVLESKLFDFNSYISAIQLPWFKTKMNK